MGKSEKKSKKKHKTKRKEHKDKTKRREKKSKKHNKTKEASASPKNEPLPEKQEEKESSGGEDFAIPIALMNSKSHAPETPEEYQRRQSQIRREVDPVTGRTRLIKGDSEVLEEIVSKERHSDINKKATRGDGEYYESQSLAAAKKRRK
ncbi:CG18428 [Drosophila busckii]|uniref:ADP-ribosylation factor-like protein 6-interacting protein 4 n=1 Tax=Drosophila busckii TaxID=30019 RepID=A0A0M4EK21_DROBS|nr:ADP-ribosylation factor-like protein 6-interacting protein 4 [Drosophila busckii]XP_017849892.1 ADP-ribosylation factor-like protein 6-interacting protein 4 [Drosophila busckii]ALC47434.1 CG18428 [Drosophila busckii]